jgi:Peptidase inhibitor I78 family
MESGLMTGFGFRRVVCGAGVALAGLLLSSAAASAGACDANKAQSLIGQSYSPRFEQKALALSGATTAALWGQGISGTADDRTDRVDFRLDRKGNVVSISCG